MEALSQESGRAPITQVWDKDYNYLGTFDEVFPPGSTVNAEEDVE